MESALSVIIPTKNEEGNILPLFRKLSSLKIGMRVIFIDDASGDRTGEVEESLKRKHPGKVDVFHRDSSDGLGKALLAGYAYALESTKSGLIAQMDGDGQHDPAFLPAMVKAAKRADVVLGSRYIENGSVGEWGFYRRLTSWGANLLVKRALRGEKVGDATTGYRVFSRRALESIVSSNPTSKGYVFQIEALSAARKSGLSVAEVPIEFKPRTSGKSKLKFRDKREFFMFALKNMFRR